MGPWTAGCQNDIALISLAKPITSVTPVTLINTSTPIPAPGTTLSGRVWGDWNGHQLLPNDTDNKRRIATTEPRCLPAVDPRRRRSTAILEAQFRNPLSPNNPNSFGLTVPVTQLSGTTCHGDSGGPVWIQTAQGLVQIGVVQGGLKPCSGHGFGYGDISDWTPLNLFLDWIAQNDPLRKVTAAPGNFNWSNPAAWVDSVPGVVSAVPNNTVISYTAGARYYDVTLSNPGTITLDMNPTIDTLAIAGAQSELVIPAPYTLEVLLGTTLSAGTLTMAAVRSSTLPVSDERRPADAAGGTIAGGWRCGRLQHGPVR